MVLLDIMNQCDTIFDLKIKIGQHDGHDLYFMVQ